jgi:predicted phosphodiesterase
VEDGVAVVVTHHSPSSLSSSQTYVDDILNGAYYSDLSGLILDNPVIDTWVHGHTHESHHYSIGDTKVICNPRGYQSITYNQETGFDENMVFEVLSKQSYKKIVKVYE